MKKIFGLFALIITTVVLTGCGNKYDTTCTMNFNESGVKYAAKVQINYSGDKVKDAVATMNFDTASNAKQVCDAISLYKETGINISCSGKKIVIKNYEKLDSNTTRKEIIESLEEEGFKCK